LYGGDYIVFNTLMMKVNPLINTWNFSVETIKFGKVVKTDILNIILYSKESNNIPIFMPKKPIRLVFWKDLTKENMYIGKIKYD